MNKHKSARRGPWGWNTRLLLGLAVFLLRARLALPYLIERYVNKPLSGINDYTGSIETVRVRLWRGASFIHQIRILKIEGKVSAPARRGSQPWTACFLSTSTGWRLKMGRFTFNAFNQRIRLMSTSRMSGRWPPT